MTFFFLEGDTVINKNCKARFNIWYPNLDYYHLPGNVRNFEKFGEKLVRHVSSGDSIDTENENDLDDADVSDSCESVDESDWDSDTDHFEDNQGGEPSAKALPNPRKRRKLQNMDREWDKIAKKNKSRCNKAFQAL